MRISRLFSYSSFSLVSLVLLAYPGCANAQCTPHGSLDFRSPVTVARGLRATVISANLTTPRGIALDALDNILVVERGLGVTAFTERDAGCDGWLRTVVVQNANLTQGIQVHKDALYVSTPGEVLRYTYDAQTRSVTGGPTTLITGIPPDGELTTRPILLFPPTKPSILLVSSALGENIDPAARDPSSGRSQIRAFPLAKTTAVSGVPHAHDFFSGTLLVYGIRNPAGFAFAPPDSPDSLWVVDNGASVDNVTGLTGAFVNDNPADELNAVPMPLAGYSPRSDISASGNAPRNRFYGFPDCTTLWNPLADPAGNPEFTHLRRGDQFSLRLEPERDDAWCRDVENNVPPRLSFQAHSVPLDLKFYFPDSSSSALPAEDASRNPESRLPLAWRGDAFVTFHGSFDREPPTGYGVVRVPSTNLNSAPISATTSLLEHGLGYTFLVQATHLDTCPGTCIRPVGIVFSAGRMVVTSDSSGELFVLSSESEGEKSVS